MSVRCSPWSVFAVVHLLHLGERLGGDRAAGGARMVLPVGIPDIPVPVDRERVRDGHDVDDAAVRGAGFLVRHHQGECPGARDQRVCDGHVAVELRRRAGPEGHGPDVEDRQGSADLDVQREVELNLRDAATAGGGEGGGGEG